MRALRFARWWPLGAALAVASSSAQMAETCARLQDLARSPTDPMMTALALHMPCVRPVCQP